MDLRGNSAGGTVTEGGLETVACSALTYSKCIITIQWAACGFGMKQVKLKLWAR